MLLFPDNPLSVSYTHLDVYKRQAFMSGTSMAAPMVTATAAMLYTSRPELSLTDIKNVILASARKMDSLNGKVLSGGMLDANGAMQDVYKRQALTKSQ